MKIKKHRNTSNLKLGRISALLSPIFQWRVGGNKKLYPRSSESDFCDAIFHRAIYPLLVVAQCFGVLPVINISSKCPSNLQYTRKSFRFMFSLLILIGCGFKAAATVAWTFQSGVEFNGLVMIVFYFTNFLLGVCLFRLAKVWPETMVEWHEVEKKLPPLDNEKKKRRLRLRLRFTAAMLFMLSLIEHIFDSIGFVAIILDCPSFSNDFEVFCLHKYPQVFNYINYNHVFGFLAKFLNLSLTFVWCFTDVLFILVSIGLSSFFKQINEQLIVNKGKVGSDEKKTFWCFIVLSRISFDSILQLMPLNYWRDQRSLYRSICKLVAFVDGKLDFITIVSLTNNLFFICVQLMKSFE